MQIFRDSNLRVVNLVDDDQAPGSKLTARAVTADEITALNAFWTLRKKVHDDPQAGLREETSDETAAALPLRTRLKAAFDALDPSVQASFYVVKAAVKDALDDDKPAIAKLIVQGLTVPDNLAATKTALLALFPS